MKKTRYDVKYVNGKEETFYCSGFKQAIGCAIYYAAQKAWNDTIEKITDEYGNIITEITIEYKMLK